MVTCLSVPETDSPLLLSDGPEVKKVASQSEIDSSLCMFIKISCYPNVVFFNSPISTY